MRIGLLSDTHQPLAVQTGIMAHALPESRKALWHEIHETFAGVDLILHGGDIVDPVVLDWCEAIAPVRAAQGNNDLGWTDPRMEEIVRIEVEGFKIAMLHAVEPEDGPIESLLREYLSGEHVDIFITGDTHFERMDFRDGVLQVNTGSPTLPHHWSSRPGTVGLLDITPGRIEARIVRLAEEAGLRNPGIEYTYTPETGVIRHG